MYTNEQWARFIQGETFGDTYPYDTGDKQQIEMHLLRLYRQLQRIPSLCCEAEFSHFGSGYASFVEFFCYRKQDIILHKEKEKYGIRQVVKTGLLLNVSRLAPLFIYGEDERYETVKLATNEIISGGYSSLPGQNNINCVRDELVPLLTKVTPHLEKFGYQLLEQRQAVAPLPLQTKIPTLYREAGQYRKLDALFYWED